MNEGKMEMPDTDEPDPLQVDLLAFAGFSTSHGIPAGARSSATWLLLKPSLKNPMVCMSKI